MVERALVGGEGEGEGEGVGVAEPKAEVVSSCIGSMYSDIVWRTRSGGSG